MVVEELARYEEQNPSNFGVFSKNFDNVYDALVELREKPYFKSRHIRERSGLGQSRMSSVISVLTSIGMLEKWGDSNNSPAVFQGDYSLEDLDAVREYLR